MKRLTLAALVGWFALLGTVAAAAGAPSPARQCRTERSEMGVELFRQTYGTNKNRSNAFGKCVSKRARATDRASADAERNASRACSAEEQADPEAFRAQYGTNKNKRNAFGKCVSQRAHEANGS